MAMTSTCKLLTTTALKISNLKAWSFSGYLTLFSSHLPLHSLHSLQDCHILLCVLSCYFPIVLLCLLGRLMQLGSICSSNNILRLKPQLLCRRVPGSVPIVGGSPRIAELQAATQVSAFVVCWSQWLWSTWWVEEHPRPPAPSSQPATGRKWEAVKRRSSRWCRLQQTSGTCPWCCPDL